MESGNAQAVQGIVWWALVAGGAIGGLTRCLISLRFEFPYFYRDPITKRGIFLPGFLGDVLIGPVAALVFQGAGAATFSLTTSFDPRGFWGPLVISITTGILAAEYLNSRAREEVRKVEQEMIRAAEAELGR